MEALIRERRPLRTLFGKLEEELQALINAGDVEVDRIAVKFELLDDTFEKLSCVDRRVLDELQNAAVTEEAEDREYQGQADFKERLELLRKRVDTIRPATGANMTATTEHDLGSTLGTETNIRNFKLPKIEILKFSGKLIDWLGWWAQFEKIDKDKIMCGSDKFIYLLQGLEKASEPRKIVARYPQSNENYVLAVEALKKRYANPDILLEVYMKELLGLIIANFNGKEKTSLKDLYLTLDSHLRNLRNLNLEKADPSTWLYPLVEACLPKDVLSEWKRSQTKTGIASTNRLSQLLTFMEKEVDILDQVELTQTFAKEATTHTQEVGKKKNSNPSNKHQIPTLAGFYAGEIAREKCIFCNLNNHESFNCMKAKRMTTEAKKEILRRKFRCFNCFGRHHSMQCNSNVKCQLCRRRHFTTMCEQKKDGRGFGSSQKRKGTEPQVSNSNKRFKAQLPTETTMNQNNQVCSSQIALQTIRARIGVTICNT